ncbi:MAG: hypothetical protein V1749_12520 [Candidatus Desantisbacteria bacterium]
MRKINLWILLSVMMILWTGIARADDRSEFRSEVSADRARESYQSALANEERIGEYQLEKTITDVHGQRVRIEEYLLRPAPDQIKFLTLNTRANRFDYGYQTFTFGNTEGGKDVSSKSLEELSMAMWMCYGEEFPAYWLTDCDMRLSNTIDRVDVNMDIGKPIKITIAMDEVFLPVVDEGSGESLPVDEGSGESELPPFIPFSFYVPSFMKGGLSINGNQKETFSYSISADGETETIIESYITSTGMQEAVCHVSNRNDTEYVEPTYNEAVLPEYPDSPDFGDMMCYSEKTNYKDGTWVEYKEYMIDDQGKVLRWDDFGYSPCEETEDVSEDVSEEQVVINVIDVMQSYQQPNTEMIISASEFEGRDIDLVIAPMQGPDGTPIGMFMW